MAKQRVQVQGVGEAPVVAPVALPGFQYGIAQRKAGTNNLLRLAGDLEQVGLITKGYAGIVQQQQQREQALERGKAAQFKEQQIEEQRRQAEAERPKQQKIQVDVLRDHLNTDVLFLLQANEKLDVTKYTSKAEASQVFDGVISQARQSVVNLLGEDFSNSLPSRLLQNKVYSDWKLKALDNYEKAQDDYILDQAGVHVMNTISAATRGPIDVVNVQAAFEGQEEILREKGLEPADRQRLLEDGAFAALDTLITQDRYNDAQSFLNVMELSKIDNRRVFGSSASRLKLNRALDKIQEAQIEVSNQSTAEKRDVLKGKILAVLKSNPKELDDMPEGLVDTLVSVFSTLDPKMPKSEIMSKIEQTFEGSGDFGQNLDAALVGMAMKTDLAEKLYFRINDDILENWQAIKESPVQPMQLTPENIKEALDGLRLYAANNPEEATPWKGYIAQEGGRVTKFDELLAESRRIAAGNYIFKKDYYTTAGNTLRENLKIAEDSVEGLDPATADISLGSYLPYSISYIKQELKKEAFKIADEDPEIRDAKLEELQRTLIQTERERFQGILEASTVDFERTVVLPLTGITKERAEEKYPTMRRFTTIPPNFRAQVKADRDKMIESGELVELGISLFRHGFTSFEPDSYKLLRQAVPPLDARDVRLFANRAEFNNKVFEWKEIIEKDKALRQLNDYERRQREVYNGFGIYNAETLNEFYDAQNIVGKY
jgi:hypothetical protein